MSDLKDQLSRLDRLPVDGDWAVITTRSPRHDLNIDDGEGQSAPARRRIVVGAVALAVFGAALSFAWGAFHARRNPSPAVSSSPVQIAASIRSFDVGLHFLEGVTVGEGAVWVAGTDGGTQHDRLLRLDPETGDIQATIAMPVPGWQFGGAGIATGLGSIWIAAESSDSTGGRDAWLYRVDPATNTVAESIDVGRGSSADVWVDDSGIWVLAFEDSSLRLFQLDVQTHEVVATIDVPATWAQTVTEAGGSIWVLGNTDESNGAPAETLFRIDPETAQVVARTQPAGGQPFFITASADRLWFFHQGLRALDAATGDEVVGPLNLPENCCSALTSDGSGGVWVLATSSSSERAGVWHVDANGVVDRHSASDLGAEVQGQASAWDAATNSIWVVRGETTVSQVQVFEGDDPSGTATAGNANVLLPDAAELEQEGRSVSPETLETLQTAEVGGLEWLLVSYMSSDGHCLDVVATGAVGHARTAKWLRRA